jgi:hypothetical protein
LNAELYPDGVYTLNLTFIKDSKPWLTSLTFEVVGSDPIKVTNTIEWENALSTIRSGGNNESYNIVVIGNVGVPGITSNSFGNVSGLTVTMRGSGKLYLTSQGSIIQLANNQNLYIEDIILEGLKVGQNGASVDNNTSLVHIAYSS